MRRLSEAVCRFLETADFEKFALNFGGVVKLTFLHRYLRINTA